MMEEHFMRSWNAGHGRFSADLDRAIKWLGRTFRQFVDLVTPGHAPGEDAYFTRLAPVRRAAKRAVRASSKRAR